MRLFFLLALVMTTLSLSAQTSPEKQIEEIQASIAAPIPLPAWLEPKIAAAAKRIQDFKGDDQAVIFPIISDVHSGGRDTYKHVVYLNHAAETIPFDFIADLGDIGLDTPATKDAQVARAFAKRHADLHYQYPGVYLQLMGNHDHNHGVNREEMITDDEFATLFNLPNLERGHKVNFAEDATYGFYDIATAKLRVFFLNTCDFDDTPGGGYYTLAPKQLQFLADNLKFTEAGWTAVILTHYCPHIIGAWIGDNARLKNGEIFFAIAKAFRANGKGEQDGVAWDFSANQDCRLAGVLTGDSHFDSQITEDGINFAITQGYGGVGADSIPEGAHKTFFSPNDNLLVDIVVLKPQRRLLKLIRMGAGGPVCDRLFAW